MPPLVSRKFDLLEYTESWRAMRRFVDARGGDTPDECWLLQHPPVYTLGQAGRREHILNPMNIPVIESDRGGQVTYHGPGQLILYTLFDLRRLGIGVRCMVERLEKTAVCTLAEYNVSAKGRRDAPGVYVDQRKIAALGLRVRKGCTFHGISLNVDMDLTPFSGINPCGFAGMAVTDMRREGVDVGIDTVGKQLLASLCSEFRYNSIEIQQQSELP